MVDLQAYLKRVGAPKGLFDTLKPVEDWLSGKSQRRGSTYDECFYGMVILEEHHNSGRRLNADAATSEEEQYTFRLGYFRQAIQVARFEMPEPWDGFHALIDEYFKRLKIKPRYEWRKLPIQVVPMQWKGKPPLFFPLEHIFEESRERLKEAANLKAMPELVAWISKTDLVVQTLAYNEPARDEDARIAAELVEALTLELKRQASKRCASGVTSAKLLEEKAPAKPKLVPFKKRFKSARCVAAA